MLGTGAGPVILPSGRGGGGGISGPTVLKGTKEGARVTHKIPQNERQIRPCTTPSTS
jgi:hypothetical protein